MEIDRDCKIWTFFFSNSKNGCYFGIFLRILRKTETKLKQQ